jgi:glycogen operon protein
MGLISEAYGQGNTLATPVGVAGMLATLANSAQGQTPHYPHLLVDALRADGPEGPRHAFNRELLLIDPYARGIKRESAREYYCVAVDDSFDWQGVSKPDVPLDRVVIYEAHARGLTRGNTALPDDIRGTYAALAHDRPEIQQMGVVEMSHISIFPNL